MKLRTAILLIAIAFFAVSLTEPFFHHVNGAFAIGLALLYWFTDRDNDRLIKALTRCSADVARNLRQQHEREGSSTRAASGGGQPAKNHFRSFSEPSQKS